MFEWLAAASKILGGTLVQNTGATVAVAVAALVTTVRAMVEKTPTAVAMLDFAVAAFLAPAILAWLWPEAPVFCHAALAAVIARYPGSVMRFVKRFVETKSGVKTEGDK